MQFSAVKEEIDRSKPKKKSSRNQFKKKSYDLLLLWWHGAKIIESVLAIATAIFLLNFSFVVFIVVAVAAAAVCVYFFSYVSGCRDCSQNVVIVIDVIVVCKNLACHNVAFPFSNEPVNINLILVSTEN